MPEQSSPLDLPEGDPFGPHNLPYGVLSTPGATEGRGRSSARRPRGRRRRGGPCARLAARRTPGVHPQAAAGGGPETGWRAYDANSRVARRARPTAPDVDPLLYPLQPGDHAPAGRGGRLRRLLRQRAPRDQRRARSSAPTPSRSPRTGSTCRSATTAARAPSSSPGTDVVRPSGQRRPRPSPSPVFGPSARLDIEAELGFVVGGGTRARRARVARGLPTSTSSGSSSSTTGRRATSRPGSTCRSGRSSASPSPRPISPWVVTAGGAATPPARAAARPGPRAAAVPARRRPPTTEPAPRTGSGPHVEVDWKPARWSPGPSSATLYWSPTQMVAHMTVNGATLRSGDLFGSGTISGAEKGTRGCFLELTWSGTEPLTLDRRVAAHLPRGRRHDHPARHRARAGRPGVGLGEVTGRITASS